MKGVTAGIVLLAVALGIVITWRGQSSTPPVADHQMGLRRTALTDDVAPPVYRYAAEAPGESQLLGRAWEGAPPLVPHSLEGLLPITTSDNLCLLCHANGSTDPADPPQVPRSHLIDNRRAPGVVREAIAGARWNCAACHVPQTDAPLLVENAYRPAIAK